ncbi:MAG: ORF6N domain-containing protein [FCB group bacterium]|jgi:hypothetical protein|nr:ORF6N domain-containing protein [FCB group bacterium]
MSDQTKSLPAIEELVRTIRGRRVILDSDLARLYGVTTSRLNEQVKRNPDRFPEDFMLQLLVEEWDALRSQNAILKPGRGQHRKYLPNAFTEHGAIMAANVLNSARAVEMSIYVVRAFIKLREVLFAGQELTARVQAVERKLEQHDESIRALVVAVRALMAPEPSKRKRIGFHTADSEK